ncbi:hypothetical protein [Streptomyces sp. NPDC058620]|uniref:hypothetical protein n=1 Tax=Streptomyces sp. NPDC058620 TaxID=3346560 RepID=UPI00364F69EA
MAPNSTRRPKGPLPNGSRGARSTGSLEGIAIGRLATDLELSKSGIPTLFGTKENLRLAAAETAREEFSEAVVRPARAPAPGTPRLWALTERRLTYAQTPLFAGGCFWAAALPDLDRICWSRLERWPVMA